MDFTLIGIILIMVMGTIFIFFMTHKIIKAILFLIGFCVIACLILGIFIFLDAKQFQEKMEQSSNLFILMDKEKPIALIPQGNDAEDLTITEEEAIKIKIINKDYKSLTGQYFKLLFIDINLINSINKNNFELHGFNLTKGQVLSALISDDPFNSLGINENNVPTSLEASKLKMALFGISMQEEIMENPVFLLKEYKKGTIKVYKETIMFRFIKYLPTGLVEKLVNKGKEKLKIGE